MSSATERVLFLQLLPGSNISQCFQACRASAIYGIPIYWQYTHNNSPSLCAQHLEWLHLMLLEFRKGEYNIFSGYFHSVTTAFNLFGCNSGTGDPISASTDTSDLNLATAGLYSSHWLHLLLVGLFSAHSFDTYLALQWMTMWTRILTCTNTFILFHFKAQSMIWQLGFSLSNQGKHSSNGRTGITEPRHFRIVRHIFDILCLKMVAY